ncbi:hypothetical protein [Oceanirhabdus sp. W0125-5]|uniref:hypothetical protein n=1 Tax=Oceanirhabdus sp. W0125-5 TaxID=2999116 RepID=UPI0022F2CF7E|nr:hypothetical protein [Oceanirhabdus sp. W0125-5]WBW99216.1 hypothetical protein OW730_10840 [Oceanirhabdus sp. W0125-5]
MNVDLYEYKRWKEKIKKETYEDEIFIDNQRVEEISYRPVLTPGKDAYWSPGKDPYLSVFKLSKKSNSFQAPSLEGNGMINLQIEEEEFIEEGYISEESINVDTENEL